MPRYLAPLFAAALVAAPVVPAPMREPAPTEVPVEAAPSSAYLAVKANDGLFRLKAKRAGRTIELVVDTGATGTILTTADARDLGVATDGGEDIELLTANGIATMRRVELDGLVVAGRRLPVLRVAIAPAGLAHSLLGQDALSRLGRITIERDRLEIGAIRR